MRSKNVRRVFRETVVDQCDVGRADVGSPVGEGAIRVRTGRESANGFPSFTAFAFHEGDDLRERSARRENFAYAQAFQLGRVVGRNRPAAEKDDVAGALRRELFDDQRKERHVSAREDRETDPVGIFLDRGAHDLSGVWNRPV